MNRRVYLEATIVSYLTSRPRELTVEWWNEHRNRFDLFISELVLLEYSKGDEFAASRRLAQLSEIPILDMDEGDRELSRIFVARNLIPAKAVEDAIHVAIATTQGMDFLITWNCKHIANAEIRERLESVCLEKGYRMPTICTPEQ